MLCLNRLNTILVSCVYLRPVEPSRLVRERISTFIYLKYLNFFYAHDVAFFNLMISKKHMLLLVA